VARFQLVSPGPVVLESERILRLDRAPERALGRGSWGGDDLNVWGGCGADLVLLRGVGSCEDLAVCCVDSCLDAEE
jgi:hypothetical protein